MAEMSPVDWAKRPLQRYAQFSGRAPRAEYWWYTLAVVIVAIVIMVVERALGIASETWGYGPIYAIFSLAIMVPGIAVTVRRLHDTDRSGWWVLVPLVPYLISLALMFSAARDAADGDVGSLAMVGAGGIVALIALVAAIVLLIFLVLPGTAGPNRFGPNPHGGENLEQVFD